MAGRAWHCVMLTVPAEPTRCDDEPHRPIRQFAPGPLLLAALIFVAASRACCRIRRIFAGRGDDPVGGRVFRLAHWALLVPLAGLLRSDLALGAMHGGTYPQCTSPPPPTCPACSAIYACVAL